MGEHNATDTNFAQLGNRFGLDPLIPMRAVMIRDPLAIVAIDAPERDRWAHHIAGHIAR